MSEAIRWRVDIDALTRCEAGVPHLVQVLSSRSSSIDTVPDLPYVRLSRSEAFGKDVSERWRHLSVDKAFALNGTSLLSRETR
jgi:hypothetical protein